MGIPFAKKANQMNFIIETDLGHDPDDLFCICHLVEIGTKILAIGLVPGSPEQITLATGLRKYFGLDFLIGIAKENAKNEHLGIHNQLIKKLDFKYENPDGISNQIFSDTLTKIPTSDLLVIGPAKGLGKVSDKCYGNLTFQGGFLPYTLYKPKQILDKFINKKEIQTFNMNGDIQAVRNLLKAPLKQRRFCGKNICHTVTLTKKCSLQMSKPKHLAGEIYQLAFKLYFEKHDEKKLHDPTALVCHLHPEIATWLQGIPIHSKNGWTTIQDNTNNYVLADIDYEKLWSHLLNRT